MTLDETLAELELEPGFVVLGRAYRDREAGVYGLMVEPPEHP